MSDLTWPVQWTASFEIGIPAIDRQHRRLVDIANTVYKLNGTSPAFECAIEEMMAYTQYHFSLEERLMKEAGYPGLAEHQGAHERLAEQVMALWRNRANTSQIELLDMLTGWLLDHILTCDQGLRQIASQSG